MRGGSKKPDAGGHEVDGPLMEGTTPGRIVDVVASLADLVSGSVDAGTSIVPGMLHL